MTNKSINIDHTRQEIIVDDDGCLTLNPTGSVIVGSGSSLDDGTTNLSVYEGAIRLNGTTKKLEYCDGTKWIEFETKYSGSKETMVYSMLF